MAALLLYLISLRGWHIIFFWVSATRTASSAVSALFEIVSEGKLITEGHAFALKVTPVSKYEVISVRQLSLSWSYMLQLSIQKFCVVLCLKKLCGCLWDTSHSTFFWAQFSCAHLQSQVEISPCQPRMGCIAFTPVQLSKCWILNAVHHLAHPSTVSCMQLHFSSDTSWMRLNEKEIRIN